MMHALWDMIVMLGLGMLVCGVVGYIITENAKTDKNSD